MNTQRTRKPALPRPAAPPPPNGRTAKAALRREQLLSTALALFAEHGYAATSTKRIAETAGVTEGLVFHYFDSKEALLLELMSRQTTFAGRILMHVQSASSGSARELFHAIARGFSDVSREEATLVSLVSAEASVNPLLRGPVHAGTEMMLDRVVSLLQAHVRRGEIREEASLRTAALGFFGGFSFFFAQHREVGTSTWRARASAFAEDWAEQCWRGIATASALSEHSK